MEKVSEKVTEEEIYEDAYYYYKSKTENKIDNEPTKKRKRLMGVFSKTNKVVFPEKIKKEVK